jgi:hypothetical protein
VATDPDFVMHGARQVLAMAGDALHLEQQIKAIEQAVRDAPNLAFDLSRSLVETVCKTILTDRGTVPPSKFKDLLKDTYTTVQLTPPPAEQAVADGFRMIVEGLDGAVGGITELRKNEGLASHGKDAYSLPTDRIQAEFAARAADAIVSFLYRCHRQFSGLETRHLVYDEYPALNEYIDETHEPVRIFQYEFAPSRVLYATDREAYREQVMEDLRNAVQDEAEQQEEGAQ